MAAAGEEAVMKFRRGCLCEAFLQHAGLDLCIRAASREVASLKPFKWSKP